EARVAETTAERDGLANTPQAFADKRVALITEVDAAEKTRRASADRLAEAEAALADVDRAMRAALEVLGAAREQAARSEERAEAAKRRVSDVAHEIHDMLEVEPAQVGALPEVADIEAELEKLRRDRERLGAVNLRAEEELREVKTQHTSLTGERDDLVE